MEITNDEIETAERFFNQKDIAVLENQARKINTEQPNFTATVLALELHGLERVKVEDLLESVFVIYYIHTELRKKRINTISVGQIAKNIQGFESFLDYYNKEKKSGENIDISKVKFLKDDNVLFYAGNVLKTLFGNAENIPREVILSYFALLKGIENGAEKAL